MSKSSGGASDVNLKQAVPLDSIGMVAKRTHSSLNASCGSRSSSSSFKHSGDSNHQEQIVEIKENKAARRPQRQWCRMAPTLANLRKRKSDDANEVTRNKVTKQETSRAATLVTQQSQNSRHPSRPAPKLGGRKGPRRSVTGSGKGNHGHQLSLPLSRRQQLASLRSLLESDGRISSRYQQQQQRQQEQSRHQHQAPFEPEGIDIEMVSNDGLIITYRDAMDEMRTSSRPHKWTWQPDPEAKDYLISEDQLEVCFHPEISATAAAIRGSEAFKINGNYYYWELRISEKCYGTSVMFGLCTDKQALHCREYCNLIGLDDQGWSLSHKGLAWHAGQYKHYTRTFPTDQVINIGLLFDTMRGELSYFMDGKNLGVAFKGLQNVNSDLYPVVGSTAKMTKVRITGSYVGYISLLER